MSGSTAIFELSKNKDPERREEDGKGKTIRGLARFLPPELSKTDR